MKRRLAWIVLCSLVAGLPGLRPTATATGGGPAAVAEIREPEVRLRKLYLVRPDLLHYPIPYDVVC